MKWKTRTIVFMGLLAAMSIILTRLFGFMIGPTIRVSFGDVPIILSGILFGPIAGAITGITADLVGMMLRAHGGFFIGFTISAALTGFIPGLFFLKEREGRYPLSKIILSSVTVNIIVSLVLNTLWLVIMYDKGLFVILPGRVITRLVIVPLEIIFLATILRALNKSEA